MSAISPFRNALLDQLSGDVCERLSQKLQVVQLRAGDILYDTAERHSRIFFPRSGVISLVHQLEDGEMGEVAMVGREGIVGVSLLVDSHAAPARAIVQLPGEALVLAAHDVTDEFQRGGIFQLLVLRYTQALIAQMAQITMCSRRHKVEEQLCRWLLTCWDRTDTDRLALTHEAIATALCVRRVGVSEAARKLRDAGLISYGRGSIRILDHVGLEERSCECYGMIRKEVARLLAVSSDDQPSPHPVTLPGDRRKRPRARKS